jgi:DNA-directed RNA polymerase subunit RPC12/RpoP
MKEKKYKKELRDLIDSCKRSWQNLLKSKFKFILDDIEACTPEVFKGTTASTRAFCYLNDIEDIPRCIICGKPITKIQANVEVGFPSTCGAIECENKHKHDATKRAIREKYGTDNVFSLKSMISKSRQTKKERHGSETWNNSAKAKQTSLEHYGVDNPAKSDEVKDKMRSTCLKRYGVEHTFQSEQVKDNIKKTSLDRYGVENPGGSAPALQKIKDTLQDRYGVSSPGELLREEAYQDKAKRTCLERHGVEHPSQSESAKRAHAKTCMKKYGCSNYATYVSWSLMLSGQHDQPAFTLEDLDSTEPRAMLKFKCLKCGKIFESKHYNGVHNRCPDCWPKLQTGTSHEEQELLEFIKKSLPSGTDVISRTKAIIPPLEIDIYVPSKHIAFEFDGLWWHQAADMSISSGIGTSSRYHLDKTLQCERRGIQLVHVLEHEWLAKRSIVEDRIKSILGIYSKTVFARRCSVKEVSSKTSAEFLENSHLQGNASASVRLGLFFENELVALMTFCKPRFDKKHEWELLRFCTKPGLHVIGAAGKLLKHFEKTFKPKSLVSYADRRWSQGKVYNAIGFKLDHTSPPSCWWCNTKTGEMKSRVACQKHKLKFLLEKFDESLSAHQNMVVNGWLAIYDCGNYVFVKTYDN